MIYASNNVRNHLIKYGFAGLLTADDIEQDVYFFKHVKDAFRRIPNEGLRTIKQMIAVVIYGGYPAILYISEGLVDSGILDLNFGKHQRYCRVMLGNQIECKHALEDFQDVIYDVSEDRLSEYWKNIRPLFPPHAREMVEAATIIRKL